MNATGGSRRLVSLAIFGWIAVCAFMADPVRAQYQITSWTIDAGLPQNSVNCIIQTRDGYLWMTTLDGLVRYDGVRFVVFNKSNTPGIVNNRLIRVSEDGEGNLWITGESQGLMRYRDGVFTSYTTADGLPDDNVGNCVLDADGSALFVTHGGIVRWQQGRFVPDPLAVGAPEPDMFRYRERSGAMWYRDYASLFRYKDGVLTTYTRKDGLSSAHIYAMCEDPEGGLWLGTAEGVVSHLKDGRFTNYSLKDGLPGLGIAAIYLDHKGNVWAGTTGGGLLQLHHQTGKFITYTRAQGLSSDDINVIYEDHEGNIWVGTRTNGLNRLRRNIIVPYSTKDGLVDSVVYPIYEDRAGGVWMGTNAGMTYLKDGKVTNYTRKDGLEGYIITALCEDREGRMWIGALGGGYWLKDGKLTAFGDKIIPVRTTPTVIYQDRQANIWLGTERGIYKYRDGKVRQYTTADGLVNNEVKDLYEDPQGRLWIATYGGVSCMTGEQFNNFTIAEGLASNAVRTIYQDGDGVLWFGTYDGGLSRFKDGRFTSYTTREGMFNNGVFRILEDRRGIFWMSCNRGIFRTSRQQLNDFADGRITSIDCIAYGKQDGLLNVECNGGRQPAGIKTRDGKLWFPTFDGVAVVDPEAVYVNTQPPSVVIEELALDNKRVAASEVLDIHPGENNLEIHYTGLSFVNPDYMRFKYKLDGLDADWNDVGNRRTAYYSHLPPGHYTFTVIAANSDGIWNDTGASLRVVIHPPFWRTWWFISATVAALFAVTLLAYRRRIANLKRLHTVQRAFSNQLIESQESERKRIAAELHDSLSQSLSIIRSRASLCLNRLDDPKRTRDQLNEIDLAAAYALEEVREIAHNLRPVELDRLGLTEAIQAMAQKVTDSTPIRLVVELDPIDGVLSNEAEINLYRIVQESLNNIVKHSLATEAAVAIKRDNGTMQITIHDNGRGFVPGSTATSHATGSGFGLVNIAERANLLGGKQIIHSVPGQGTTITINVALKDGIDGQRNPHLAG